MSSKRRTLLVSFFYIILIFLFTKIDYRFIEEFTCCQDDHDYYSHAETIALDFDFDYSNQYKGYENKRYYKDGVIAPKGFVGSGLFASPFLLIGQLVENYIDNSSLVFNYRILFYSLSAIFYFLLSIYLVNSSLKLLKVNINLHFLFLVFMGSGVSYYAFERYSMTHVYEVFTTSLLIYISVKFYTEKINLNLYSFLIPLFTVLALSVRWVNYQIFFIPFLIKFLFKHRFEYNNYLLRNKYFYFSYIFSVGLFLTLNKFIYGIITFNPVQVYGSSGRLNTLLDLGIFSVLKLVLTSMFQILFSQEFGIFWFSPIIYVGLIVLIYLLFTSGTKKTLGYLFLLVIYGIPFSIVILWQSTASSYGYRYLFSLIPIAIIIYGKFKSFKKTKTLDNYLLIFSIFAGLSILFFETSVGTSLSQNINSFNVEERFSQPKYLQNYISSFMNLNSYLKIFTTSFLGVVCFKLLSSIFQLEAITNFLSRLSLPVENPDFASFLENIETITLLQIIIFSIILIIFVLHFLSKIIKNKDLKN